MALALGLVGQPVQPYLTTGATDFVNSVQKGKEDAIKTEALKTTNQKSALDLLTAQKKAVKEEEVSSTMPELMGRIAKGELTDKQKSDFLQAYPEMAQKYIATNDEKAKEKVNNAVASTLLNIAHSADKVKAASDGVEALKHFGINLNLRGDETPEQIQDALTVSVNGMKALEATGSSVDASGRVVKTNKLGQVTDMGAAPTEKAQKAPVTWTVPNGRKETTYGYDANGKQVVLGVKNLDAPKSPEQPKQPRLQQVTNENGTFLLNIDTGEVKPVMIGGKQLQPVKPAQTPSGEESNAAGFLVRMKDATKLLDTFEGQGKPNMGTAVAGSIPLIGGVIERTAQTKEQQQYKNAALAWIRAKLRKESGAAIGKAEAEQEYQNYFPVVGDTKEVIAQKRSLRQSAMDEMRISSGKAAVKVDEARPKIPPKNAQGWLLYTDKYGNKAYVSPDGKQYQKVQ
jgi:hypothetical protein